MHIRGHSAAGGRHGSGRQQDRMRDPAQKQQGRHILSVNANAEVQAEFGTVTALEHSDGRSARHRLAY
jgi:hypothetical protein